MTCFVPFCDSTLGTKKGEKRAPCVSFHQFPTDVELKKKWIFAIGKKDPKTGAYWEPHNNAVVCSLHFSPKQFNIITSKKMLKHGSIPFIFPDYYLPERGTLISQEDLSSMKIIPFPSNANSENTSQGKKNINGSPENAHEMTNTNGVKKTKRKKRTFSEMNTDVSQADEIMDKQACKNISKSKIKVVLVKSKQKHALTKLHNNGSVTFEFLPDLAAKDYNSSSVTNSKSSNRDALCTTNLIQNTMEECNTKQKSLSSEIDSEKKKNAILASEILKLQEENDSLKLRNRIMQQKFELLNIAALQKGVINSDAKALFLFDQLSSLTKKECNWSESTMNFTKTLEKKFPTCYDFLRQTNILTLPAPTISTSTNTNVE